MDAPLTVLYVTTRFRMFREQSNVMLVENYKMKRSFNVRITVFKSKKKSGLCEHSENAKATSEKRSWNVFLLAGFT